MAHVVKFVGDDDETAIEEHDELAEALARVEELRNTQGIEGAKVFRLDEVKFEVRTHYTVELADGDADADGDGADADEADTVDATDADASADEIDEADEVDEADDAGEADDVVASEDADEVEAVKAEVVEGVRASQVLPPPLPTAEDADEVGPFDPASDDEAALSGSSPRRGLFGR